MAKNAGNKIASIVDIRKLVEVLKSFLLSLLFILRYKPLIKNMSAIKANKYLKYITIFKTIKNPIDFKVSKSNSPFEVHSLYKVTTFNSYGMPQKDV